MFISVYVPAKITIISLDRNAVQFWCGQKEPCDLYDDWVSRGGCCLGSGRRGKRSRTNCVQANRPPTRVRQESCVDMFALSAFLQTNNTDLDLFEPNAKLNFAISLLFSGWMKAQNSFLRPYSHWTRSNKWHKLPCSSNSLVHTAHTKQCAMQHHTHNWRCAPFLRVALIADDPLFILEICQILEENAYQKVQVQVAEYEESKQAVQKIPHALLHHLSVLLWQRLVRWCTQALVVGTSYECCLWSTWQRWVSCPSAGTQGIPRSLSRVLQDAIEQVLWTDQQDKE